MTPAARGNVLALDTSTYAVTVAVHDGSRVLASESTLDARRHAEILMPTVRDVVARAGLRPAALDAVAVGVGPGPFTGLRAGIVTGAVLGEVLGIPAHGVCGLDAIAHEVVALGGTQRFLVATDARRKEVYWAVYESAGPGQLRRITGPAVSKPADLPDDVRSLPTAGRGGVLYPDLLPHAGGPLDVDAGHLAAVVLEHPELSLPLQPLYLRQPDATPPSAPKSVLP